ncbi:hypothetical protein MC885_001729 [Smutsia gigantea]|nr:hypothetical protein MC885_001729 [Smutsia gigantea]
MGRARAELCGPDYSTKHCVEEEEEAVTKCHNDQSEFSTVQDRGSHEELSCWQIWQQISNDLTKCQDSGINCSQFHKQGDSPCQVGTGLSIQISENENFILDHKVGGPNGTRNPEFPTFRAQDSCRRTSLIDSQNYQNGYERISMRNKLCWCKQGVDTISCISHHLDDHGVHKIRESVGATKADTNCL